MSSTRGKRLKWNTISSLTFQLTTLACGFILPRLILGTYGSQVNGLVNSITQFLHIIAFLELGVGAVVQSSLYKPLSEGNNLLTSQIVKSADIFFSRIAIILSIYICILIVLYPSLVNKEFSFLYTATLIIAIGISSFAQYFFGVVDRLLLTADQHGYIQYNAQTATLIVNTILCALFIKLGASIHIVKLTTSLVYLFRPVILRIYVNKHYAIDRKVKLTGEPIKQKWNGIAQHVAAVVLDQTDIIVLTAFSTLTNVSVYSVYQLVVSGVKNLFVSLTSGFQSLMGEYIAKEQSRELKSLFDWTEWLIHTGATVIFGCTAMLVVPFVRVYTNGVNDANYAVPLFAVLITLAHAGHCLRLPYNLLILAAGHYKQTQHNYIIAASINILLSITTVRIWGLIGVAIGTLVAMFYQTIWMAMYDSKAILSGVFHSFLKHIGVDAATVFLGVFASIKIPLASLTYRSWIIQAVLVFMIWAAVSGTVNLVFYREKVIRLGSKMIRRS